MPTPPSSIKTKGQSTIGMALRRTERPNSEPGIITDKATRRKTNSRKYSEPFLEGIQMADFKTHTINSTNKNNLALHLIWEGPDRSRRRGREILVSFTSSSSS